MIATSVSDGVTYTYTYQDGKLVRVDGSDNTYTTLTYESLKVTVSGYEENNSLSFTEIYTLNSKGLATSCTGTGKKKKSMNLSPIHSLLKNTSSYTTTFEYNNDGYLIKSTTVEGSETSVTTLTITDGNSTSGTVTYQGFTVNMIISHNTTKENTIGQENEGVAFLGKQDVNLITSMVYSYNGTTMMTTTYQYEFDTKGRVIKCTESDGTDTWITNYSYKE
jgi:hypothetical protein